MLKKIRSITIMLILGLLALLSLASRSPLPFLQATETPGPKLRAAAISLEAQAGHSDGILVLGILIFVFIAVPIILRYKNFGTTQESSR